MNRILLGLASVAMFAGACGSDGPAPADDGGLEGGASGAATSNAAGEGGLASDGGSGDAAGGETGGANGETGGTNGEFGETGGTNGETGGTNGETGGTNGETGGTNGETGGANGETGGTNGATGGGDVPATDLDLPYDGEKASICYAPGECNGDDLLCFGAVFTAPGLCVEDCAEDSDCSKVGGLAATCTNGKCLVNCAGEELEGDGPCPADMECRDLPTENVPGVVTPVVVDLLNPNFWCVYPTEGGTNTVPDLGKCELGHGDGDCKGDRACHMPGFPDAHGYCARQCEDDDASGCKVPSGVTATPLCAGGVCEYDCGGPGDTCPTGMNCRDVNPGIGQTFRCRYID